MKKFLLFIVALTVLAACSQKSKDEKIRAKIIMQKERLNKITKKYEDKIAQLQSQLSDSVENEKLVPVEVKNIQPEEFNHYLTVYGNVEAENYGMISPEMSGKIEKIYVDAGDYVKEGTLLLTLNTAAIQDNIESLKTNLDLAKTTFEKQERLWNEKIGSEIQYLQAKTNYESAKSQLDALEEQLRMSQLRAPYNGYVDKILMKEGELVSPGFPVVEFVNLNKMVIKADISENYISDIREGQMVQLSFSSLPDFQIKTPIVRKAKVIDKVSRTFEIELNVDNSSGKILPNMVSTIKINDFSAADAFVIPSLVIRKDISGDYVYTAKPSDGKWVIGKQYIQPKLSYDEKTMITQGLQTGDKVVIKGYHLVSSGMPVNVVNN